MKLLKSHVFTPLLSERNYPYCFLLSLDECDYFKHVGKDDSFCTCKQMLKFRGGTQI